MIENAAHVRDIERVYQARFSKMAFGDRPAFWMLDNDRAAAALKYGEADPGGRRGSSGACARRRSCSSARSRTRPGGGRGSTRSAAS